MKKYALIVAGGSGNRMNSSIPKQFTECYGKPVLMHTFEVFYNYDSEISFVLVLPENQEKYWNSLCEKYNFNINYKLAFGGETRFDSVKNGLDLITDKGIVFIHDGVRPLVSQKTIENCFTAALETGNALPVIPVSESVRKVNTNSNKAVNRSKYVLVQTPQTFKTDLIKKAYLQKNKSSFTDDASVAENTGIKITLVEGNRENIKITYPEDMFIVETILRNRNK